MRERVRQRHHEEMFWYGNFRNQTPDSLVLGWETYESTPRFGTNLFGLRGRLSILSEAYSNAPFGDRIRGTYDFVREILSLGAEERVRVKAVTVASERFAPDSVALRAVLAPPTMQDVIAEITQPADQGSGPYARRKRTGVFRKIRMPVYDRFTPSRQEALPAGYLLPPQHGQIAELLRAQGVVVERLERDWSGPVEAFRVDSLNVARLFQGHRLVSVEGAWSARTDSVAAGWFYVSTAQRLGVLAAYLLEPESEDGYVTWNFFDRDLRPRGEYPVLRVRSAVVTETTDAGNDSRLR